MQYMSSTTAQRTTFPVSFGSAVAEQAGINEARGRRIEALMDNQGWGPSDLARVMRVARTLIYGWKAGKPISSEHLERLAVALETTRHYIQTGEGDAHYPRELPPLLYLKQLAEEREAEDS
jgi:transcriptional regulator with XRE-family HTH domain